MTQQRISSETMKELSDLKKQLNIWIPDIEFDTWSFDTMTKFAFKSYTREVKEMIIIRKSNKK